MISGHVTLLLVSITFGIHMLGKKKIAFHHYVDQLIGSKTKGGIKKLSKFQFFFFNKK